MIPENPLNGAAGDDGEAGVAFALDGLVNGTHTGACAYVQGCAGEEV